MARGIRGADQYYNSNFPPQVSENNCACIWNISGYMPRWRRKAAWKKTAPKTLQIGYKQALEEKQTADVYITTDYQSREYPIQIDYA